MAEADPLSTPRSSTFDIGSLREFRPEAEVLERSKIVAFDSRDLRSRPFNLMRTKFTKQLNAHNLEMVGITSPAPMAGKSCLSMNLAAALARLDDKQVVLVDLDLRRGSIAEEIGLEFQTGINDYLTGAVDDLSQIAVRIADYPLAILPTKAISEDSSSMLAGKQYVRLMENLRAIARHAIVLIDLPPVFANDDAMLTAGALDAYMMIVDAGKTTQRQLKDSMEMLRPTPCVGTVLNRYKGSSIDSYGYGSKAYSRYYD
ncbi:CpsD/CapB family tyrosine-protein kinase [Qipengyuania atrilutea]|uniref:CpsD/CapB family tyrosine-protein kinase n=1 Tax=Qipengyuania atrilutea TaxID=2744473 RepID=A0A850H7C5_9SPHN|nr:CpsD/CapB family tyrosine-protein kinase [Actirhodobacter atriluteus]NVD45748.1 CpsD/CapB family tyrosine-protein kinase [Actirhodobacter atriluteus]